MAAETPHHEPSLKTVDTPNASGVGARGEASRIPSLDSLPKGESSLRPPVPFANPPADTDANLFSLSTEQPKFPVFPPALLDQPVISSFPKIEVVVEREQPQTLPTNL